MNVHLSYQPPEEAWQLLKEKVDPVIHLSCGTEIPEDREIDILVDGRPDRESIETLAGARLQALIVPWAGIPAQTRQLMEEFPTVQVCNLHHNAAATAELAVSLLLAVVKGSFPMTVRCGKTIGAPAISLIKPCYWKGRQP